LIQHDTVFSGRSQRLHSCVLYLEKIAINRQKKIVLASTRAALGSTLSISYIPAIVSDMYDIANILVLRLAVESGMIMTVTIFIDRTLHAYVHRIGKDTLMGGGVVVVSMQVHTS
jgi:hypothetical protein